MSETGIIVIERSKIETKPFNIDYRNNEDLKIAYEKRGETLPDKSDDDVKRNKDDLSKYPVVYINGITIDANQIKMLTLFNDSFVPELYIEFSDNTGKLIDESFPLDNAIVSIFKDSTNDVLMGIKMDFKITDFRVVKGFKEHDSLTYAISASIDLDDLYINNFESFKGTSFKVLKDLSINMKLGFASNVKNSEDEMVWINPSNYRIEFMREIIDRTYINDETFIFGFIDNQYNFNYIDIDSQLKRNIDSQMNFMDSKKTSKDATNDNDSVPLILSNDPDVKNTNLYIRTYTLLNSSTNVNLQYGYRHRLFFYDKTGDEVKAYNLDNITDDNDNNIVMKDNTEGSKNNLFKNHICNTYMGKIDAENVHKEYYHSILQNKNNLKFLQKIKIVVKLDKINYNLYRFQKVLVELYNMGKLQSKEEDPEPTPKEYVEKTKGTHDKKIIHLLSGEWLITAINITYSKKDGNSQEVTLVKRELTKKYDFPRRKKK